MTGDVRGGRNRGFTVVVVVVLDVASPLDSSLATRDYFTHQRLEPWTRKGDTRDTRARSEK